jgi:hypothetical protein
MYYHTFTHFGGAGGQKPSYSFLLNYTESAAAAVVQVFMVAQMGYIYFVSQRGFQNRLILISDNLFSVDYHFNLAH